MAFCVMSNDSVLDAQPRPTLFEPLKQVHTQHPSSSFAESASFSASNGPLSARTTAIPVIPHIDVHLIISDSRSDSSLTPGWVVPKDVLSLPVSISMASLFEVLQDHLPPRGDSSLKSRSAGFTSAITGHSRSSSSRNFTCFRSHPVTTGGGLPPWRVSNLCQPFPSVSSSCSRINGTRSRCALFRRRPRPRLDYAKVYLLAGDGEIVPLCRDDASWYVTRGIAKCDLVGRTDADWRLLKDLLFAAGEGMKCYIAIKGVDFGFHEPAELN